MTTMLSQLIAEFPEIVYAYVLPHLHPRDIAHAGAVCRGSASLLVHSACMHARAMAPTLCAIKRIRYYMLVRARYKLKRDGRYAIVPEELRSYRDGTLYTYVYVHADLTHENVMIVRGATGTIFLNERMYGVRKYVWIGIDAHSALTTWTMRALTLVKIDEYMDYEIQQYLNATDARAMACALQSVHNADSQKNDSYTHKPFHVRISR